MSLLTVLILLFFIPIARADTPLAELGRMSFEPSESNLQTAAIDTDAGFAYFGTRGTTPLNNAASEWSSILKIRLSDFTMAGKLVLEPGERALLGAAIDYQQGIGYFVTEVTNPGKLIKVRLSDLQRLGALTLNENNGVAALLLDSAHDRGYLGFWNKIVQVRLSDMTVLNTLQLAADEASVRVGLLDSNGQFAYFGTSSRKVIKIDISGSVPAKVQTLSLNATAGIAQGQVAVLDPQSRIAYFGTEGVPAQVVKINLVTFTQVGSSLTLGPGEMVISAAAIDPAAGYAYFATTTNQIVRIRLSTFSRVNAIALSNPGEYPIGSAVIDPIHDFAYFGAGRNSATKAIVRIRLSTFSRVDSLPLEVEEDGVVSSLIDSSRGFAYYATLTNKIVRVQLNDFTRRDALTLLPDEFALRAAVLDPEHDAAYFGLSFPTAGGSGKIVRIRLSDFTRQDALTLSESRFRVAVLDPLRGYAYFGTETNPGKIVCIRVSDFSYAGSLTFTSGEGIAQSAVIDPIAGFVYFGTTTQPPSQTGRIIKVDLASFSRVGTLGLQPNEEANLFAAALDTDRHIAYFVASPPSLSVKVVKIDLTSFSRVGALVLNPANDIRTAVLDPTNNFLYLGSRGGSRETDAYVSAVDLSTFTQQAVLQLQKEEMLDTAVIDPGQGVAYFGRNRLPGGTVKTGLIQRAPSGPSLDLAVEKVLVSPPNPIAGQSITVSAVIRNQGTVRLNEDEGLVSLRISYFNPVTGQPGNFVYFDPAATFQLIPALDLQQAATITWSAPDHPIGWNPQPGTYVVEVFAAISGPTSDYDLTDNLRASQAFDVTASTQPDLFVDCSWPGGCVNFSPLWPSPGSVPGVTAVVRNVGAVATPAAQARLRIDGLSTGVIDGAWDSSSFINIPALEPNSNTTLNWTGLWRPAQPVQAGRYRFEVCIDPNNIISEGNENNNCSTEELPVFGVSLQANGASQATGTAPLAANLSTSLIAADNQPAGYAYWWNCLSTSANLEVASRLCGAPNATSSGLSAISHIYDTPGAYSAKVIATQGQAVAESRVPINVVANGQLPDLIIPSVVVTRQGRTLYLTVWVKNQGGIDAGRSKVLVTVDRPEIEGTDLVKSSGYSYSTTKGQTRTETFYYLRLPAAGRYAISVCADGVPAGGVIPELNETNNCWNGAIDVP